MTAPPDSGLAQEETAKELFYLSALTEAEREHFERTLQVEGIDQEIAVLRLRLRQYVDGHPDDFRLLQSGVRLLVQALLAQHRLSPKQAEGLSEAAAQLLEEFGAVLSDVDSGMDSPVDSEGAHD